MRVAPNSQDVVSASVKEVLECCGDLAEVPFGELVGLVAHSALGQPVPARVGAVAQREPIEVSCVPHLAEIQLPGSGRLAVNHSCAAAGVLAQNREHRMDPRRRVDHHPVADRAGKPDDLEHLGPGAREDRHSAPGDRLGPGHLLYLGDVASKRHARFVIERSVISEGADPMQEAVGLGLQRSPSVPPPSTPR